MNSETAFPAVESLAERERKNQQRVLTNIFGPLDTTPWSVLWLALAWACVELIPGSMLVLNDLTAKQPTGESLPGAFFCAAALAAGATWIWWTITGNMPDSRRWEIFLVGCLILVAARILLPAPLVSLTAVLAWTLSGVTAVSLAARNLLGVVLEPPQTETKGELTILLMLRYTLAAAVLAWFTRSIANDENALLSTFQILAISIPLGIAVGLLSLAVLWILATKHRWIYISLLCILCLPISAATTIYFTQLYRSGEMLIAAIYAAATSLIGHLILFGLPLIARGFRLHWLNSKN